ncbi:MAG: hypothetical protein L3J06_05410 [Cyclobacteriaceae bacterium]|nr:hypothetical protein [Cyclobacteriaceae bacterium]
MNKLKHLWVIALLGIATNCQQNEIGIAPNLEVQAEYTTARDMIAVNFCKKFSRST